MGKRDEARQAGRIGRAIGERLSFANVVSVVALFVALGGSAWALSRGEVKSKHSELTTTPDHWPGWLRGAGCASLSCYAKGTVPSSGTIVQKPIT